MNNISIIGKIKVELIDKKTNKIKQVEEVTNTITDAYKKYALYILMNTAPFGVVSQTVASGTVPIAPQTIGTLGMYALNKEVNIHKDIFIPPYSERRIDSTLTGDVGLKDVTFYNIAGSTTETFKEMVPVPINSYLNPFNASYQMQYTKSTGEGEVKSIVIGRSHRIRTATVNLYSVFVKDLRLNSDVFLADNLANYLYEPTINGTIIHKQKVNAASGFFSVNLKTRNYQPTVPGGIGFTNITNYYGGIVANNTIFDLKSTGVITGNTRTITLRYVPNWKFLTTAKTLSLTFESSLENFLPAAANNMPVIVLKDSNTIEVFMTTSVGEHIIDENIVVGANIKKAVIDISEVGTRDLTEEDITYVDCGIINQVIGYIQVADTSQVVGTYVTGQFLNNKYYLPISGEVSGPTNAAASINMSVNAAYQEGAIFDPLLNFEDYYCVRNVANNFLLPVDSVDGVKQILPNIAGPIPYFHGSQVISGTNLPTTVVKTFDDVLRITYTFSMEPNPIE